MPLVETAKFPGTLATATDLLNWKNVVPSLSSPALSLAIGSGDTTINLVPGTGTLLPADNFVISIDDEIILISSRSTDTLTVSTRGYENTSAASHLLGAVVQARVTAKAHNQSNAEVVAIETALGINLRLVHGTKI